MLALDPVSALGGGGGGGRVLALDPVSAPGGGGGGGRVVALDPVSPLGGGGGGGRSPRRGRDECVTSIPVEKVCEWNLDLHRLGVQTAEAQVAAAEGWDRATSAHGR